MLRPRRPQQLGFDLNDIPIVGPLVSDVGHLLTGDVCGAIPVNILPGLKDVVSKIGCTAPARDALIVELNSVGGPVTAAIGAGTMAACLCSGKSGAIPGAGVQPAAPPPSAASQILSNPLVWVGAAAVILGLVLARSKKSGVPTTATTTFSPVTITTPATITQ